MTLDKPLNILLVEDDPDDYEFLHDALKENKIQFQMECITEGDKVISYLEKCSIFPDVMVMDLNLPKMHGKEILIRLKESPSFRIIPVIILTTSSAKEDIDFCIHLGVKDYITKPITLEGYNFTATQITRAAKGN